jgi:hypothetical protein
LNDLDPNTRAATMVGWPRMFANDPAKRQELANLLASWTDPKLGTNCLKSLISEFSKRSPSEAAAFVETLAVSESVKDQLSHEVIGEWATKEPKQAFNAWMERGESEVPKPLLHAMDKWSTNGLGANESFEWVNGLERGPVKEQLKSHMVTNLTLYGHLPQAATLSAGLEESIERIRRMRWVKEIWDQRDPKQANEWFAKLPPEDRDLIEGK